MERSAQAGSADAPQVVVGRSGREERSPRTGSGAAGGGGGGKGTCRRPCRNPSRPTGRAARVLHKLWWDDPDARSEARGLEVVRLAVAAGEQELAVGPAEPLPV